MPTADEEMTLCPVDLEMLCVSITIQGMDIASKLRTYAIFAVQGLWEQCSQMATIQKMLQDKRYCPWYMLQQNLGQREALVSKPNVRPPLPQPVERRVHLTSTTEDLEDIKTHLQLLHAALDNLRQRGERINENFGWLQRLVQDIPTCRCEAPRDRCTSCTRLPKAGPLLGHSCNIRANRRGDRLGGCPTMLQVDRLDVPMNVVKRPTAVQAFGAALLDQLVKAVDEGDAQGLFLFEQQSQLSQMPAPADHLDTQDSGKQARLEMQDGLDTDQSPTKTNIALMYQVLARDV